MLTSRKVEEDEKLTQEERKRKVYSVIIMSPQ